MDMLVKLYDLPEWGELRDKMKEYGIVIRRPLSPEKGKIAKWIAGHFNENWRNEFEAGFPGFPVTSFIAVRDNELVGFACYDVTKRGFFGPTGVLEKERGKHIGKALLFYCLQAMWDEGYGYAIIGGTGPAEFYRKNAGAVPIEGSAPGVYRGML